MADMSEIDLLKAMLKKAEERAAGQSEKAKASDVAESNGEGPKFAMQTFNAISPVGLTRFPKDLYVCAGNAADLPAEPMAIMMRSHKLKEEEVAPTVRCIARCGAGTNNIPVARMAELGIPVFNTPGANANAVKELVICALLLASRGIVEGTAHVQSKIIPEEKENAKIEKRIEADKAMFGGQEIARKTLGVIGLGAIGARVVDAALALGMEIVGYDPALSLDAAMRLPGDRMECVRTLEELLRRCDYVTLHVPYIPGKTHHLINEERLALCKPGMHLLNFARGELVDGQAVKKAWASGKYTGKYLADFADEALNGHPKFVCIPHLGASTAEAEDNCAAMAADTLRTFLETGAIRNSVNFPTTEPAAKKRHQSRLCIVHRNEPGVLGELTSYLGTQKINITQQVNNSHGKVAYTVIDMEECPTDPAALQEALVKVCPELISSRFIGDPGKNALGMPGTYFHVSPSR